MTFSLSLEDAQKLISAHGFDASHSTVVEITEVVNDAFSYTRDRKTYVVDLSASKELAPTHSCFISVSLPSSPPDTPDPYHPNSLQVIGKLISLIHRHTAIPIADPSLDTSRELWYLITPIHPLPSSAIITLSHARNKGLLTAQQLVLLDLTLGKFLGQLHSGVMNEWFGLPLLGEPPDPSYSWQETFTSVLEALLAEAESKSYELPFEDIRRYLSRAIAFFLFDDVQVPSLVWFTGSDDDIYISLDGTGASIAAILPNVAHAIWGDPLLESFFMSGMNEALLEGYKDGGGETLVVFSRQKTKRLWYTLFLALVVLTERNGTAGPREQWAKETIMQCADSLKDAPCH
ncbi:uncharacterized protein BT62DRAFT_1012663 [Guyanagaster necrorhizus]|uniref:Aminoglycoside phosphotransferase domain-containing protein n=1 Tax=Guyanagaster necrorhizus TaxID=856835 RepID=A0A9P7VHG1_9AGAR|nr:uncharacterized protein BT62DRAFT_1012663 [Guyanagaster necrorhizus MCA 3950]KAG7440445.1 hypothetical protein BT62DRAFT_1012663 [Guyanagaster necrorhizus MCA 3950]